LPDWRNDSSREFRFTDRYDKESIMYKTPDEIATRILSMSAEQAEEQNEVCNEQDNAVDGEEDLDKRGHITVVPFNPVQTGSFQ